jgi:hypothetical protein
MEPTTIILGISGITLLAGITLKLMQRGHVIETEAMANARHRASKRAAERALIGDVQDDFAFRDVYGFQDNHDVSAPNEDQQRVINLLLEGNVMPVIHRPVFPGGVGHLEAGGMSMAQAVYVDENKVTPAELEVVYLDADYQWPEKYNRGS